MNTPPRLPFPAFRGLVQDLRGGVHIIMVELTSQYMRQSKKIQWNLAGNEVTEKGEYCRALQRFLEGVIAEKQRQCDLMNKNILKVEAPWAVEEWHEMPMILWLVPNKTSSPAPCDNRPGNHPKGSWGNGSSSKGQGGRWGQQGWGGGWGDGQWQGHGWA